MLTGVRRAAAGTHLQVITPREQSAAYGLNADGTTAAGELTIYNDVDDKNNIMIYFFNQQSLKKRL